MMHRRPLREIALCTLYAHALDQGDPAYAMLHVMGPRLDELKSAGLPKEDRIFCENLYLKTVSLSETADALIGSKTANWDLERIALIDRLILRLAITEWLEFEDIPPRVSLNEAIELAKTYSTGNSGKFVNGILDAVLTELKKENRLHKTGAGLLDLPSKKS